MDTAEGGREWTRNGRRRVVVTGVGAISPIGHGREGFWAGLRRARSGVRRITRFDPTPFRSQVAAQVDDFDPHDYINPRRARKLDRYSQFAVAVAQQALADAALVPDQCDREQAGVYLGSALGGLGFAEEQHRTFVETGIRTVDPILALTVFGSAASCNVAMDIGFQGPNMTNANSCASGAGAIGEAFRLIQLGEAAVMLAGGVEAPLQPLIFGAFSIIRAISYHNEEPEKASRPFDAHRDGFVMAEGAGLLVLEDREHAVRRAAPIYCEILGYGTSNDAYHMTAPLPSGAQAARAMRLALADARLAPDEIEYINAHGSATPLNDKTERRAIGQVFGAWGDRVPVSGTKGMHGHALGASGAWEAVACALGLARGWLPPAINIDHPDPECDLNLITGDGLERRVRTILSNSFGFGGVNVALVFGRGDA